MALKDTWKDLVNGESEIAVEPINEMATAIIALEGQSDEIESALDSIIAIQESLIGGEGA
jgi:hypothetical protein